MTSLKLLSAAVIATAMLSSPVLARQHHVRPSHLAADAVAAPAAPHYAEAAGCTPEPHVGAFATAPWDTTVVCVPGTGMIH
jgi:hypothetical protein